LVAHRHAAEACDAVPEGLGPRNHLLRRRRSGLVELGTESASRGAPQGAGGPTGMLGPRIAGQSERSFEAGTAGDRGGHGLKSGAEPPDHATSVVAITRDGI